MYVLMLHVNTAVWKTAHNADGIKEGNFSWSPRSAALGNDSADVGAKQSADGRRLCSRSNCSITVSHICSGRSVGAVSDTLQTPEDLWVGLGGGPAARCTGRPSSVSWLR